MTEGEAADPPRELLDLLYARSRGGAPRDPTRTRALLNALAIPDPPHVIHVVGTNGKGSVAWRLDAALAAAGRVSLRFLSPHVEHFHERIAVAGVPVTPDEVASFLERAWRAPAGRDAAFFELCTALALEVGARRVAEWAVLEAGVGAARDATLAVGNVRAVVLTNVAMDHADALGPELADIARDKAAAIRPGVPVVTAARGEPLRIVRTIARERGAPLRVVDESDVAPAFSSAAHEGTVASCESAALARAALAFLDLPAERRPAALAAAGTRPPLPARRERFRRGNRHVLLDGAHNPAAAAHLARALAPGFHLLLGVLARKDPAGVAAALGAKAARVTLTAAEPGERPWGRDPRFTPEPDRALHDALAALPEGGLLVVAGSFHLAGHLRPLLRAWALNPEGPADASSARTPSRRRGPGPRSSA